MGEYVGSGYIPGWWWPCDGYEAIALWGRPAQSLADNLKWREDCVKWQAMQCWQWLFVLYFLQHECAGERQPIWHLSGSDWYGNWTLDDKWEARTDEGVAEKATIYQGKLPPSVVSQIQVLG